MLEDPRALETDDPSLSAGVPHAPPSHAAPRNGGVLVVDKHITFASLHSPLPTWLRRDVAPFVVGAAALIAQAAPALLYEAQCSWIRSGEEEAAPDAHSQWEDAAAIDDAAALFAGDLSDATTGMATNATNSTAVVAPPTAAQLAIKALPVPDSIHFYFMYLLPVAAFLYAILWLCLYWNVKLQVAMRYRRHASMGDIGRATHIRVQPVEHGGKSEICELRRVVNARGEKEMFFVFQKTKYIYHTADETTAGAATTTAGATATSSSVLPSEPQASAWFEPLDFPVEQELQSYITAANAGVSDEDVEALTQKYGENSFDIPLPPFADLFKEHALAPFFVFQIFCVLLWCLDEYWYYSLVTLFMLVIFEATVVKRRLKSLEFLREMRMQPYKIHVHRGGAWTAVLTSHLVPGDIVSLVRPKNEQHVIPADILLVTGGVVCMESMLTGESTPVHKESVESSCDQLSGVNLDINKAHKGNVLFGGTKILMHTPPSSGGDSVPSSVTLKSPPDGGCVGVVLRTGFNTAQGRLVRTILFSSESVSINNTESLLFIAVLLVFAIAAAAYVCMKGLEDETRSRYKLMLNAIMIVTSVVPPELPMELSLAVNTSLLTLMRCHIFCTEPFRIPLAGAVDVCCFDKTGTLTADEFIVKGIAGVKAEPTTGAAAASSSTSSTTTSSSSNVTVTPPADGLISSADALPLFVKYVIAGCHSLTFLPEAASSASTTPAATAAGVNSMDHLIGDPLEKSSLAFVNWGCRGETSSNRAPGRRERLRCLHKYAFSSELKRMSVVVALEHEAGAPLRVVTKGAAEVLEGMFDPSTVPADYTAVHTRYSQQGCRVLALGYKDLSLRDCSDDRRKLKSLSRSTDIECGLTFAGFLVLQCPLKKDSRAVIAQLKASTHQVVMITGDHVLTACSVAAELDITTKPTLILQVDQGTTTGSATGTATATGAEAKKKLLWRLNATDNTVGAPLTRPFDYDYSADSLERLCDAFDLGMSGDALDFLLHHVQEESKSRALSVTATAAAVAQRMALLVRHVSVFARTSPDQKELVLHWLKTAGLTTLMCGDGTNDVGALKQAHIGVALIGADAARVKPKAKAAVPVKVPTTWAEIKEAHVAKMKELQAAQAAKAARAAAAGQKAATGPVGVKRSLKEQLAEQMAQLDEMDEENTTPRLGDASVASPFTSKTPYITSCVDIIRQGRCTLVTTLQMFNILGINCLLSAYSLSVLYLDGVKYGDTQMTISSLSIAMFFLFISRSQPLKELSAERPHKKLFTPYMLLSVLGQFALHMLVLLTAIGAAQPHTPDTAEHKSPDKTFVPNVLNTVVYLVGTTQTVATFAANYRGRPFMESLRENTMLYKSLSLTFCLMMVLASEMVPSLNASLELHPLPSDEFKMQLLGLLVFDLASTYIYSKTLRRIFAVKPSKKIRAGNSTRQPTSVELSQKKVQ